MCFTFTFLYIIVHSDDSYVKIEIVMQHIHGPTEKFILSFQKLAVPDGIAPTNATKRGWIINPLGSSEKKLQVWGIFLAIVPAFMLFILVFMETLITR